MPKEFFRRLTRKFEALNLLRDYFKSFARCWQDLLWGESPLAVIWGFYFIVGNPPAWVNWAAAVLALLVAGYYVWRADHLRLIPKVKIEAVRFQPTPVTHGSQVIDQRVFVQLMPKCLTESPIYECDAYLQKVDKLIGENQWKETILDRNLVLKWAGSKIELHLGSEIPLNIFFVQRINRHIVPCLKPDADIPLEKFDAIFRWDAEGNKAFRFYVQITCSDRINGKYVSIAPVRAYLEVRFDADFLQPSVDLVNLTL